MRCDADQAAGRPGGRVVACGSCGRSSGYRIGDVLHNLTEEMAEVLDRTGADVTLVHDGQQPFVTAAVEAIANLEREQENWQKGPCLDAVATSAPVAVPDIAEGDAGKRWPEQTIAAKTAEIRAVAGIPMLAEEEAEHPAHHRAGQRGARHPATDHCR